MYADMLLHHVLTSAGWCLGVTPSGGGGGVGGGGGGGGKHRRLVGTATAADSGTLFDIKPVDNAADAAAPPCAWIASLSSTPHTQFDDSVVLTQEQQQHFVDQGFLQVEKAVSQELVHAALGVSA